MKTSRLQAVLSLPKVLLFIVGGMVVLSLLFFTFWQRLNRKVEDILKEQFNQQQLELARKIADNVESHFDYLESELLAYPWRFRLMPVASPEFDAYMAARFENLERLGILEIRLFDQTGRLQHSWKAPQGSGSGEAVDDLEPALLNWVKNPKNRGRLFLGEVHRATAPPWQGRLVMPLITALYKSPSSEALEGALELLIDPLVIARLATAGVRSGATGYPGSLTRTGFSWHIMNQALSAGTPWR
jgi:two-component system, NtrC family, sensor histidine kinase HydH